MGFADKLMFWKKKDDFSNFDFDKELGLNLDDHSSNFNHNPGLNTKDHLGSHNPVESNPNVLSEMNQHNISGYGQEQQRFGQQQPVQHTSSTNQAPIHEKNFEILSTKLDTIRAALDNIEHRLANLERIANDSGHNVNAGRRRVW